MDIVFILFVHWVADFVLQTRYQGNNKSHNVVALLNHTMTYSFCWFSLWSILGANVVYFVAITFICHTVTDFFTSKLTAFLWGKRMHFVGVKTISAFVDKHSWKAYRAKEYECTDEEITNFQFIRWMRMHEI